MVNIDHTGSLGRGRRISVMACLGYSEKACKEKKTKPIPRDRSAVNLLEVQHPCKKLDPAMWIKVWTYIFI